jgi:hypothetical protein
MAEKALALAMGALHNSSVLRRIAIVAAFVVTAAACKHNKQANTTVRERAAFDLLCPPDELKLGVVDTEGARNLATQIAVYGCQKKAVYVYYPDTDTWVIDGAISELPEGAVIPIRAEERTKRRRKKAAKARKHGKMDSGY